MPTLLLVRHGQASIHAEDYDVLSEMGHRQASALGAYFKNSKRRFARVVVGPLQRQQDTCLRLLEAGEYLDVEPVVLQDLKEFPAFAIVDRVKEKVATYDEVVRRGLEEAARAGQKGRGAPAFRAGIERIATRWANNELEDIDDLESFAAFQARVRDALAHSIAHLGSNETGLVVTSGGVIAIALGDALGLSPGRTMTLMWEILNGSFHELRCRDGHHSLVRFNAIPHLELSDMVTHV